MAADIVRWTTAPLVRGKICPLRHSVLLSVSFFNRCKNKYLRMSSIVFGLCLGYGLAFALGKVNMSALNVEMLMSFNIPATFQERH
ncbi:MAG: hypothetical protein V8R04_11800 [Bacteroides thetaiotaomicron]